MDAHEDACGPCTLDVVVPAGGRGVVPRKAQAVSRPCAQIPGALLCPARPPPAAPRAAAGQGAVVLWTPPAHAGIPARSPVPAAVSPTGLFLEGALSFHRAWILTSGLVLLHSTDSPAHARMPLLGC